ncbi:MAG: antitoxin VapB family protein [Candidatus Nanohaloarchaea archaeon]
MASKTISLREEAYQRLKALKDNGKSFSDVVMEITEDEVRGFENIIGEEIDITVEDLIKMRREEDFIDEEREELLSR